MVKTMRREPQGNHLQISTALVGAEELTDSKAQVHRRDNISFAERLLKSRNALVGALVGATRCRNHVVDRVDDGVDHVLLHRLKLTEHSAH